MKRIVRHLISGILTAGISAGFLGCSAPAGPSPATMPQQTTPAAQINKTPSVLLPTTQLSTTKPAATPPATSAPATSPATSITVERYKQYSNGVIQYTVPEIWREKVTEERLKYYYPEDSMLMVSFDRMSGRITDESVRSEFLTGMKSGMESFELLSESELTVAGTKAYRHEMNIQIAGSKRRTTMVLFDYKDGVVSLLIGTIPDSGKDYSQPFDEVVESVKFISGQEPSPEVVAEVPGTPEDPVPEPEEPAQEPEEPEEPDELTIGEENALEKAEQYLSFMAFSKKGLKEQLDYEGFSKGEIEYALDNIEVDWNEQAVSKAEDYLDTAPFSKKGLIGQLEFEGFTSSQAEYGVAHIEVDWNEQAALKAESYLELMSFSRKGLIDQLKFEGFTRSQAEYGAKENGP